MNELKRFRRDAPQGGGGRVAAWRYVFGKRVLAPGGPVASGEELRITSRSEGLPETLLPLLNPLQFSPTGSMRKLVHEEAPGRSAALVRPARTREGRFVILQRVAARSEGEEGSGLRIYAQSTAFVFRAEDWAAAAPGLAPYLMTNGLQTEPDVVEGDTAAESDVVVFAPPSPDLSAETRIAATRLLAALESQGQLPVFDRGDFEDAAGYWRACGALLNALPAELRPLLSAADGFAEQPPGALLRFVPVAGRPPRERRDPSAERAAALLRRPQEELTGAAALDWEDAADAGAALRDLMMDAAVDREETDAFDALQAFLTEPDPSMDAPPLSAAGATESAARGLRRVVGAAHAGAAFRRVLPDYGLARAAALIASATDADWRPAWEALKRAQPGRYFWSALLLREPDWLEPDPIRTLAALNRLCRYEERIRDALPADAPTPMDGPAFRRRLARLAERGAERLTVEPEALVAETGERPAAWVRMRPDLFLAASEPARAEIAKGLDAIELAARLYASDAPLLSAVEALRLKSFPDGAVSPAAADPTEQAQALGARALAAQAARAPVAADFWAGAFERHLGRLAGGPGSDALGATLTRIRRALALEENRIDHATLMGSLEAARRASAPGFSHEAGAAPRELPKLARHWIKSWRGEGAAVRGAAGPLKECAALTAREGRVAEADLSPFAAEAADALDYVATRQAEGFGPAAALRFATEALETLAALGVDGRETALGLLARIDRVVCAPSVGGASLLDSFPDLGDALIDAVIGLAASWTGGDAPAPYLGEDAPELTGRAALRLGAPMARYLLRLDPTGAPRSDGERVSTLLARFGPPAERALAMNTVAAWRERHAAYCRGLDVDAPKALSGEPGADVFASAIILRVVERDGADAARWIGEDALWAVRELSGIAHGEKDRGRGPAPKSLFDAWDVIGQLKRGQDLAAPQGFVLFLLTRLLQTSKRSGAGMNALTGPFLQFLTEDFFEFQVGTAGKESREVKGMLRGYVWGGAVSDDADLAARLDRALLFLSLVETVGGPRDGSDARLRAPILVAEEHAERLAPPRSLIERLVAFLKLPDNKTYREAVRVLLRDGGMGHLGAWRDVLDGVRSEDGAAETGLAALRRKHFSDRSPGEES